MKVGFYDNMDDTYAPWLNNISQIEIIPLLRIEADREIKQTLDYLIARGAPRHMINYWEGLKELSEKLPKTKFLIQELPYCNSTEIREKIKDHSNLEILKMNPFLDKVND